MAYICYFVHMITSDKNILSHYWALNVFIDIIFEDFFIMGIKIGNKLSASKIECLYLFD